MMRHVPDWSGLLPDLVAEIAGRMRLLEDFMAMRGVCTSWRAVAASKDKFGAAGVPLLMLAEKDESDEREFYSLSKRKVSMRVQLPEAKGRRCVEARFGWLLTLAESGEVSLLNPFTRAQIHLPNYKNRFPGYMDIRTTDQETGTIRRALLSANPSDDSSNFVLMVVTTMVLGFWRPGDRNWTTIGSSDFYTGVPFINIGYCKDKFYAVDWSSNIWVVDPCAVESNQAAVVDLFAVDSEQAIEVAARIVTSLDRDLLNGRNAYLVGSSDGELMLITRDRCFISDYGATDFEVIHIDVINGEYKILSSLDKEAVFIGWNAAFCLRADNDVVKPNCIYFTDDCYGSYSVRRNKGLEAWGGRDMGVYNIEDQSIERFDVESLSHVTPPLWVDSSVILKH